MAEISSFWYGMIFFSLALVSISLFNYDLQTNLGSSATDLTGLNNTNSLFSEINETSSKLVSSAPQTEEDFSVANFLFKELPAVAKLLLQSNSLVLNQISSIKAYIPLPSFIWTIINLLVIVAFVFAIIKLARGVFGL